MTASFLTSAACAPAAIVMASASEPAACTRYPDSLVLIMVGSLPFRSCLSRRLRVLRHFFDSAAATRGHGELHPSRVSGRHHLLKLLGPRLREGIPVSCVSVNLTVRANLHPP